MIITYLVSKTDFEERGVRAAMYFDDLVLIAHESEMEGAVERVLKLFQRWGIPRQEKKFAEDNPNGKKGSRWLTILGLKYDLADLTIAISKTRVLEIMAEMKSILAKKFATKLKQWESTIGVISWTTTAIPQIKMFLTVLRLIQAVKAKSKNKNQRIKMIKDIEHDWKEIIYQLETWNGCQKIMRKKRTSPTS